MTINNKKRNTLFSFIIKMIGENSVKSVMKKQHSDTCESVTIRRWIAEGRIPNSKTSATYKFIYENKILYLIDAEWDNENKLIEAIHKLVTNSTFQRTHEMSYIKESYLDFIKDKPSIINECFDEIKNIKDQSLPYYKDRNSNVFFNVHLDILKNKLKSDYDLLSSRFLRETIDNKEYIFPAINLLPDNNSSELSISGISSLIESTNQVSSDFLNAVKLVMPNITNNATFAIDQLDLDKNEITCRLSSYFKALYSCDRFQYQITTQYPGNNGELESYKKKVFLDEWSDHLKEIVLKNNYSSLDASIGCSCLFVYKTNVGYEYFIGHKSDSANGLRDMHVIPSFMFQPVSKNKLKYKNELSIKNQVLRELGEEVFGYEEYEGNKHSSHIYGEILADPVIKHLEEMVSKGKAEFIVTGLWLDLYRLRPEITTLFIIHDPEWFSSSFSINTKIGNWEVEKGGLIDVDVENNSYHSILNGEIGFMCSPGLAALITGMNKMKTLINMA